MSQDLPLAWVYVEGCEAVSVHLEALSIAFEHYLNLTYK